MIDTYCFRYKKEFESLKVSQGESQVEREIFPPTLALFRLPLLTGGKFQLKGRRRKASRFRSNLYLSRILDSRDHSNVV